MRRIAVLALLAASLVGLAGTERALDLMLDVLDDPTFADAASGLDPVAANNAIDLLGVVLDDGCRFRENRRTVFDRARAVRALVADRSRK